METMGRRSLLGLALLAAVVAAAGAVPAAAASPSVCGPKGIATIGTAEVGQTLTITGCGFGAGPSGDGVDFWARTGGGPGFFRSGKTNIADWSDTQIDVVVPTNATNGALKVTGTGGTYSSTWTPAGAYIYQSTACRSGLSTAASAPAWHFQTRQWDLIAFTITRSGGAHVTTTPTGMVVAKDEHAAVGEWYRVAGGGAITGPTFGLDAKSKWVVCSVELGGVIGTLDRVGGSTSGKTLVDTWDSGTPKPTTIPEEGAIAGMSIGTNLFSKTSQSPSGWFVVSRSGDGITGGFAFFAQADRGVPEVTVTDANHTFTSRGVIATFV